MENDKPLPKTLLEAIKYFSDRDNALNFMAELRWPDGIVCPHCSGSEVTFLKTRRIWKCRSCRKQFSIKTGTVLEDSPIGLDKWLSAIWIIVNAKNGVSSYELHRSLGITQKSAWFLSHRIRLALKAGSFELLSGEVEVDETFIGGKARNMHKGTRALPPMNVSSTSTSAVKRESPCACSECAPKISAQPSVKTRRTW